MLQHEELWGSEESEFLIPIANALKPAYDLGLKFEPHSWLFKQKVDLHEFAVHLGKGLADLYSARSQGKRWVEQTPSYTLVAEELALMFPTAQFLFIIRDGRQVADSMQKMWQWNVEKAAMVWHRHTQSGLVLKELYPQRVFEVRYEALISAPQKTFKNIFEFLNLPYADAAAEFIESKPINVSPGTENQTSSDKLEPRWPQWPTHSITRHKRITGEMLQRLGYQ